MNYLELVQKFRRKARVSGTGPVTLNATLSEEYARLRDWVDEAWLDIQGTLEDWQWMRSSCSFATVAGQATYTAAQAGVTDLGNWTRDSWRLYPTATGTPGEQFLEYIDYERWRDGYQFSTLRTTETQPLVMTITPAKAIGLGPTPAAGYTVTGDYFTAPSTMTLDAQIPALPEQFHMLIVYRAMMFFGASEAASEVYQEGQIEFERMMRRLQLNQLPELGSPPPLA
jgi:hypothetical protein